jgi:hypothetical protein
MHGVDACVMYGKHPVADKTIQVGYTCSAHSFGVKVAKSATWDDDSNSDQPTISSSDLTAPSSFTFVSTSLDATESILTALDSDEVLRHLWPQIVATQQENEGGAEKVLERFIRRYGQHLRNAAKEKLEVKASRLIRTRSRFLANGLYIRNGGRGSYGETEKSQRAIAMIHELGLPQLEDDSEAEDIDQSTIDQFEDVRDFCLKGESFLHLRQNVEMFVAHSITGTAPHLLETCRISMKNILDRFLEQDVPANKSRLRWTCVSFTQLGVGKAKLQIALWPANCRRLHRD